MQTKLVPAIAAAVIGRPARRRRRRRRRAERRPREGGRLGGEAWRHAARQPLHHRLRVPRPGALLRRPGLAGALHDQPDAPQLPGQAGARRLAARARRGRRVPARLARRADVHVHDQVRPPLQRRLGRDRSGFKRAFERAASPQQGSPAIAFMHDVVGADERNEGKAGSVAGVAASGQTLTIRLKKANPTFLAEIAMPFFRREAEHGDRQQGDQRLSVRRPLPDRKPRDREPGRPRAEPLLQGQPPGERRPDRDHDEHGREPEPAPGARRPDRLRPVRPAAHGARRPLAPVRRQGRRRPLLRQHRHQHRLPGPEHGPPAFQKVSLRKAVNHAIDRPRCSAWPASTRASGPTRSCRRTCRASATALYPIKGANPVRGRALANGAKDDITLLYPTSPTSIARAQILKYNLEQIGLSVTLKPQPFAVALRTAGTRGADFDAFLIAWFADYRTRSTSSTCCSTGRTSRRRTTRTTPT